MSGRLFEGFTRFKSFMGPLFSGAGVGGSAVLWADPDVVGAIELDSDRVALESRVDFLETVADVELDSEGVVNGFGAEAKFLNEAAPLQICIIATRRRPSAINDCRHPAR